ncbi:dTDP-4-dehydrorhamnose 3,5-epimerase [Prochlorococcus marinus]|uniref:dTDP-4-dehydrorhamnose 3,5-epimerase n=1 Tax=Prochlorococcus marinus TaxID=1219 RepID=UPI001ADAF5F1|nr:dTDP-4-dehydrorhamnose 3,5-epimerase [Prochlorococcus marinus]MBO8219560.1 dTDP-4-dehydrorhamnose 3,5-epimerase [Prochlorococcus marinus CUG1416]MBW3051931.1 dTDP-4-dehydrorhamnose 3,5-epimerase [Prochlorococcus marinus str. MU1416]
MEFKKTNIIDCWIIEQEKKSDERGFFSRSFCTREFKKMGLNTEYKQSNISMNLKKGTVRGMHLQNKPYEEIKLINCFAGSIFDVVVDLRKNSPSFLDWVGTELNPENGKMIYVPKGCAHGYQSLSDNSFIHYMVSEFYNPDFESGLFYNDEKIGIKWPEQITQVSAKDKQLKKLSF